MALGAQGFIEVPSGSFRLAFFGHKVKRPELQDLGGTTGRERPLPLIKEHYEEDVGLHDG